MSEQDEAAARAAALMEGPLSEYCVHDGSPAYVKKYECFPADWTGAKREDSCFVNVITEALRNEGARARREALEEAARFMETHDSYYRDGKAQVLEVKPQSDVGPSNIRLAAAIRALMEQLSVPSKRCKHTTEEHAAMMLGHRAGACDWYVNRGEQPPSVEPAKERP